MAKIIGRLNNLGISKESSRGTALTAAAWMPQMEMSYDDRVKTVVNEASIGRLEGSEDEFVVQKYGEVTMKSKIRNTTIGYLLLSLLGTDTPAAMAGGNSAVYEHTFSVGQTTQHQSLTLSLKGPNDAIAIPNAVVDSLKIKAEFGNFIMFEAHALGKTSAALANTATYGTEYDFTSKHVTFKTASAQSGLTAASAIVVRGFELEIKSNVITEDVLGSVDPSDILNQSFSISGSVTLVHTDATYHDLMNAGTPKAMRFDLQNTDITLGASTNPGLQIDLHKAVISNYSRKMTINELVEETFDFTAHYSTTDSKMVTIVLRNLTAAY